MNSSSKGMELAASTIVILIVSILILASATILTYRVVCSSEELAASVDKQSEQKIENLMRGGGLVAVADNTKVAKRQGSALCGASSAHTATFSLGIKNPAETLLSVTVRVGEYDDTNTFIDAGSEIQFFDMGNVIDVQPGTTHYTTILFANPGALNGDKVYTVLVEEGTDKYGVQQIFVQAE